MNSIALCDDHELVTDSLSDFIIHNTEYSIAYTVNNGKDLITKLDEGLPDLILLDISMPSMDGLEVLDVIRQKWPKQRVLVLSMFNDETLLLKLLRLRINGYLSKGGPVSELLKALKEIEVNGHYYSEQLIEVMYKQSANISESSRNAIDKVELDDVDQEILKYICDEMTSKEMAKLLFLSPRTVEGRRKKLLKKLGAKNQTGLVLYAVKKGLHRL